MIIQNVRSRINMLFNYFWLIDKKIDSCSYLIKSLINYFVNSWLDSSWLIWLFDQLYFDQVIRLMTLDIFMTCHEQLHHSLRTYIQLSDHKSLDHLIELWHLHWHCTRHLKSHFKLNTSCKPWGLWTSRLDHLFYYLSTTKRLFFQHLSVMMRIMRHKT